MSRHSQHSNDRSYFTYKERVEAGFTRTKKDILSSDAFLPFGHCCLSLKVPKDPVATPDGYVYDREAILEALVQQKLDAQEGQKLFDEQELRKDRQTKQEKQEAQAKEIQDFQDHDMGTSTVDTRHRTDPKEPDSKKLRKGELLQIDKAKLREKSFWAKEATPTAAPAELKQVDKSSRCPMSGKKLRVKDLVSIKFDVTDQKLFDGGGGRGVFCCAVTKSSINHQQAVLLKPSGQVVLESVLKDCVYKDGRCPVTGVAVGPQDVIKLKQGGSGFAAHNDVQAKSFVTIRSRQGDDRLPGRHLPAAGYQGLR